MFADQFLDERDGTANLFGAYLGYADLVSCSVGVIARKKSQTLLGQLPT